MSRIYFQRTAYASFATLVAVALVIALFLMDGTAAIAQTTVTTAPNAATTTSIVTVPWGDLVAQILKSVQAGVVIIVTALAAYAGRQLPQVLGDFVKTLIANHFLDRAVNFGFNTTIGAVQGKTVGIKVGSAVAANALTYFVTHAPSWLQGWLGKNESDIKDRILARIPVDGGTIADVVGGTVAAQVTQPNIPVV